MNFLNMEMSVLLKMSSFSSLPWKESIQFKRRGTPPHRQAYTPVQIFPNISLLFPVVDEEWILPVLWTRETSFSMGNDLVSSCIDPSACTRKEKRAGLMCMEVRREGLHVGSYPEPRVCAGTSPLLQENSGYKCFCCLHAGQSGVLTRDRPAGTTSSNATGWRSLTWDRDWRWPSH